VCGFETSTGTTSRSNRPCSIAASARRCDSYEYASSSSRESPHSSAISSAEIPCGTISQRSSSFVGEVAAARAHRHARHRLDSGRDDEVELARPDRGRCVEVALHRRAALPVDGRAGHRVRPARDQRRHPADVPALLADLRDAAHLHVLDLRRIEPVPLHERVQHLSGELVRAERGERAVPPADRRADGVDDESLGTLHDRSRLALVAVTTAEKKLLVAGEWIETGEWLEVRSPYSGEVVSRVAKGGAEETKRAIDAAEQAMLEPLPAHKRAEILVKVVAGIARRHDEIARQISDEAGKPLKAARVETSRAMSTYTFAAVEARKLAGEMIPMDAAQAGEGKLGFTLRRPIGIVGAISPFNFPLNLVAHKLGAGARGRLRGRAQAGEPDAALGAAARRSSRTRRACHPAG
jgi:hypothetical protein